MKGDGIVILRFRLFKIAKLRRSEIFPFDVIETGEYFDATELHKILMIK
jgi:hypothetical protein